MRLSLIACVAFAVLSIGSGPTEPRRIWTIPDNVWGPVSPDGRYMASPDVDDGEIYLYDVATGSRRRLTNSANPGGLNGEPAEHYADDGAWTFSPDGRQLAYEWRKGKQVSLRVVSTQAGIQPPRVLLADSDIEGVVPGGWSPDGAWLAFDDWRSNGVGNEVGLVSVADGVVRMLKKTDREGENVGTPYFSPDARYVVYEHSEDDWNHRSITIVDRDSFAETSGPTKIDGELMGWIDLGVAYVHHTDDSAALFVLPTENGKTAEPRRLTADLPNAELVSFGQNGALYYRQPTSAPFWRSMVVAFDFATGRPSAAPAIIAAPKADLNMFPASWSRDGKSLALVAGQQARRAAYIRNSETGEVRAVPSQLNAFQSADLSPDGRAVAMIGTDKARHRGLFLVDSQTGAPTLVAEGATLFRAWSADGAKVYFDRPIDDGTSDVSIVERDVTTRNERDVHRASGQWAARLERAMSSDGKTLYYLEPELGRSQPQRLVAKDLGSGKTVTLVAGHRFGALVLSPGGQFIATSIDSVYSLVPTTGGAPKPVPMAGGIVPVILAWSPDGRSFIGRTMAGMDPKTWKVSTWWVPVDGRAPRKVDLNLGSSASATSSNGSAIAFIERIGTPGAPVELWMQDISRPPGLPLQLRRE